MYSLPPGFSQSPCETVRGIQLLRGAGLQDDGKVLLWIGAVRGLVLF